MMGKVVTEASCPACGATLSQDGRSKGLCPGCVLELALESPSLLAELEETDEEQTLAYSREAFVPGQILGKRFRIRSLLGRGGMGEVWRATDLKLRVDVALKALHRQLLGDSRALETLRQEVRSAREVVSPNVCRVFDLVELDGQELVSMEYIDGITLLNILKMRAPLDLSEAREIAAQFLAGLEAIHAAGLVHRDVKPENLMMTRSGRVVLMDFGIAKGLAGGPLGEPQLEGQSATVSGTPAYMSPEQSRGEALDARADVFSAGVVLAEMIAPGGLKTYAARQQIWKRAHHQPPKVAETPWSAVLRKSVAHQKEQRFASASALARALEEVTLRAVGDEDLHPYPGLLSFTEDDAEYFFGRELEIEEMWKKLRWPHLLALIGPSGAGKSSFLRAGLLSVIPTGWRAVVVNPGSQPFSTLARSLVPELAGDTEALQLLTSPDDAEALHEATKRWRSSHDEVLLILDQFEELFTQNPPDVQQRFAELLARLAIETDLHVLLSMRDDFLFHCTGQESLSPIFSELTPLKPLSGTALRRALVQPALKCGYRFEDESLVDEMVEQVGDERGALPLLAFAAARLWSLRDREKGLLTREAYEHIGGVGGALAQHAEQTLEKTGQDNLPVVREIFRNLVTSQGTRVARGRDELLSVFGGHDPAGGHVTSTCPPAADVLDTLIDARLLTAYEEPAADDEREPQQRIEIIHESLLTNWPRLVRWRTQDADSAQLRDQIRQAAQMWIERGRPQDLLWTGTSYKEYELWRERYEGGLSDSEERFAGAMKTKAERRKRQRRLAIAAAFALLMAVLAVVGLSRQQALQAARRAEAQKLLALGELELEKGPTVALAHATASLELADTAEARMFTLRALAAGPPATVLPMEVDDGMDIAGQVLFSPDGEWMAIRGIERLQVVSRDGQLRRELEPFSGPRSVFADFDPSGKFLFGAKGSELRVWSVPDFHHLESQALPDGRTWYLRATSRGIFALTVVGHEQVITLTRVGGQPQEVGRLEVEQWPLGIDRSGERLEYASNGRVFIRSLEEWNIPPRVVGPAENRVKHIWLDGSGDYTAMELESEPRAVVIWPTRPGARDPVRTLPWSDLELNSLAFDPTGRHVALIGQTAEWPLISAWDLSFPEKAPTLTFSGALPRGGEEWINESVFEPGGRWLATAALNVIGFWALPPSSSRTLHGHPWQLLDLEFTPDGRQLVSVDRQGEVLLWNLETGESLRLAGVGEWRMLDVDPRGRFVAIAQQGGVLIVPLDGGPTRSLDGFAPQTFVVAVAVDADGLLVAAASRQGTPEEKVIRVWDLESGESWTMGPTDEGHEVGEGWQEGVGDLAFLPDGSLVSVGVGGLRLWPPGEQTHEVVAPSHSQAKMAILGNGVSVAYTTGTIEASALVITNLETGKTREVPSQGDLVWPIAVDASGTILVTGSGDGIVRVGPVSGEEPHLLLGHERVVMTVAVSPDGKWIASGSEDRTIRIWPMPDISRSPLQTLPHDELVTKLRSLTNVRVVEAAESSTGWKIDVGPFPGWEKVPTW